MTPLEAAKVLVEMGPYTVEWVFDRQMARCWFCGFYGKLHRMECPWPDSPWQHLPAIVAVLEAAERVTESWAETIDGPPDFEAMQALRRAVRGRVSA